MVLHSGRTFNREPLPPIPPTRPTVFPPDPNPLLNHPEQSSSYDILQHMDRTPTQISIFLLLILFQINNQKFFLFKINDQRIFLFLLLLKIKNQQFFKIKNQYFFLLPFFSIRMFQRRTWSFVVEGLLIGNPCHPFLQPG